MKAIIYGFLILSSTTLFADTTNSDMSKNWICTTNASSSEISADQTADNQMSTNKGSATDSFAFAEKNCRDCTKITCEIQD